MLVKSKTCERLATYDGVSALGYIKEMGGVEIMGIILDGINAAISVINTKLAKDNLREVQKENMPLVRYDGELVVTSKSIKQLRNEVTFDFDKTTINLYDNGTYYNDEDDNLVCITTEIKNCGNAILNGLTFEKLVVMEGNEVSIDAESQEDPDCLCYLEKACTKQFTLLPNEKKTVNFLVTKNVMERECYDDFDDAQDYIERFFEKYNNIVISTSLIVESINDSKYYQKYLRGTYNNNKIVDNAFASSVKADF